MAHNVDNIPTAAPGPSEGMVTLTHVLYALHRFSALMGLLGTAFIVTAFLTGWPSIIAVIVNYVTDAWRAREQLAYPSEPVRAD